MPQTPVIHAFMRFNFLSVGLFAQRKRQLPALRQQTKGTLRKIRRTVRHLLDHDRLLVGHELADGSLVQLQPDYQLRPEQPLYAVYPARPWLAFKTATFVAFLQERLFA